MKKNHSQDINAFEFLNHKNRHEKSQNVLEKSDEKRVHGGIGECPQDHFVPDHFREIIQTDKFTLHSVPIGEGVIKRA
jgi:hypothetical protein